jgi:glucose-1-phosphate thymidylyltransferase
MFVETIEKRQGYKIACLEEIAYNQGWLDAVDLQQQAGRLTPSSYGDYLRRIGESLSSMTP